VSAYGARAARGRTCASAYGVHGIPRAGARSRGPSARASSSRATGETARKSDPSTLNQLTPRELQIALDLASGLTTREAAAKLYLSPKTVEYQLRSVYRKLGIASRSELAGAVRPADPGSRSHHLLHMEV